MHLAVKKFRLKQNLTQKELAKKIHISRNYLSKIESNTPSIINGVRFGILIDIAKVLNIPIDKLIEETKEV